MPAVTTKVTTRIAELLEAGEISISASFYSSGTEIYGRVMRSHPRLGLYPHDSYKLDELEILCEKVWIAHKDVSPVNAGGVKEYDHLTKIGPSSSPGRGKLGQATKVTTRSDPEIGKIPVDITLNGVRNTLPKSSLCWKDLANLSDDQLNARLLAVGREIGADKAVSKIESSTTMTSPRAATLFKWWITANTEDRWALLTNQKYVGKKPDDARYASHLLTRIGSGQYPFRGTDRKMEEEEAQEIQELEEAFERGFEISYDSEFE